MFLAFLTLCFFFLFSKLAFSYFICFGCTVCTWNLSFSTREESSAPALRAQSLNH